MTLQTGQTLGQYKIVSQVGKGGMATVYKAYHERLDRHVALKVMHTAFLQDDTFLARFEREARIIARLEHPHIVPIYDYSEQDGNPYLVMKFIDGMTLKQRAYKVGYTPSEIYRTLLPIAEALDYAHRQGILHRDLKPSNIMVDKDGNAYLTDFGLARIAQVGESTLSHDMMLGTPFYISPEQAQGLKDLSPATDLYSLGVVLYELVTGSVPFVGDTPYVIVHAHIYKPPAPVTEINPDLPAGLDDVMTRALAKDPADRYESASALLQAFGAALGKVPPKTLPTPTNNRSSAPVSLDDLVNDGIAQSTPATSTPAETPKREGEAVVMVNMPDLPKLPKARIKFGDKEYDLQELGEKFKSGVYRFAEQIEERLDEEMRQRKGISATDPEEEVRKRVRKKIKARDEFVSHLFWFILVNGFLVTIWFFTGGGFPWFLFPLLGWGMGLAGHGMDYYNKYGAGADKREVEFERKLQEELMRSGITPANKAKHSAKAKNDWEHLEDGAQRVRLTEDGELSDSFIADAGEERRQRRR